MVLKDLIDVLNDMEVINDEFCFREIFFYEKNVRCVYINDNKLDVFLYR